MLHHLGEAICVEVIEPPLLQNIPYYGTTDSAVRAAKTPWPEYAGRSVTGASIDILQLLEPFMLISLKAIVRHRVE